MNTPEPPPEQVLELLLQSAVSQTFPPGTILLEEGRHADAVYYVIKGKVSIVKNEVEINTQSEGCMVGELGVLMGKPRSASVICMTQADTLRVEAADFLRVVEEHPAFLRSIFNDVVTKLQTTRPSGGRAGQSTDTSLMADFRALGNRALLDVLVKRQQAAEKPCWHRIGVWGDGSCPQLSEAIHCRNCPVFATAGRSLLDRRPSVDYVQEWTEGLAQPKEKLEKDAVSVVIFRLAQEWLALPTQVFQEITHLRPIHAVPHRTNEVFLGMVNVRGELLLCFSLADLLGVAKGEGALHALTRRVYQRLAVAVKDGQRWVFPVDEVFGIHQLPKGATQNTPVTVAKAGSSFARGVMACQGKPVELLDDELVFYQLKKNYL
jgi:chemotaxis-related protein WspD